jgi:hypothetical protein
MSASHVTRFGVRMEVVPDAPLRASCYGCGGHGCSACNHSLDCEPGMCDPACPTRLAEEAEWAEAEADEQQTLFSVPVAPVGVFPLRGPWSPDPAEVEARRQAKAILRLLAADGLIVFVEEPGA